MNSKTENLADVVEAKSMMEHMSVVLNDAEIDAVSGGGRWILYTDDGRSCDGSVWVY